MDKIEDVAQISCGHSIANSLLCFQNRQKFCLLESRAFEHLTFNREDYQPNVLQSVFQTALLFIYETVSNISLIHEVGATFNCLGMRTHLHRVYHIIISKANGAADRPLFWNAV